MAEVGIVVDPINSLRPDWTSLSSDLVRFLSEYLSVEQGEFAQAAAVCRDWALSLSHPHVFVNLSKQRGWPSMQREQFIERYSAITAYERREVRVDTIVNGQPDHALPGNNQPPPRTGNVALTIPVPVSSFDWASGSPVTINAGVIISFDACPGRTCSIFNIPQDREGKCSGSMSSPVVQTPKTLVHKLKPVRQFSLPIKYGALHAAGDLIVLAQSTRPTINLYNVQTKRCVSMEAAHTSTGTRYCAYAFVL
jgi:hypothetical protein